MRYLAAVLLLAATSPGMAAVGAKLDLPAGSYAGDRAHTSVTWRVMHFGLSNYTARFAKVASTIVLDPVDVGRSKLDVTIDANSVRTDFPFPEKENFDAEIGGDAKFLNGKAFPKIRFVSTRIVATGPKTAQVTGDLTLRGVTRPVTLDVRFNGSVTKHPMLKVPVFGISATGLLKRSAFGMDYGLQFVGDDVTLQIEAEFQGDK